MKEATDHLEELKEIRSLMERSSRFISLSGLSGIFAGAFALAGAAAAYWYIIHHIRLNFPYLDRTEIYLFFFGDAAITLTLALLSGIFFTTRQAKKKGQKIWDKTSQRLIINVAIPLIAGGFFILALLLNNEIGLIVPASLIFYGLALLNGSKFTLEDIRYLAYSEIALGIISCFLIGYGLIFWSIGFGVLHIIYGAVMYFKYEK